MKSDPKFALGESSAEKAKSYATREEVEAGIRALTDEDHVKLMLIAGSFCRSRRFSPSVLEPQELLSEAMLKTLQMDKKWNKQISMLKHLDRAMENLSGHLAGERSKIIPFPNGLTPEDDHLDEGCVDDALVARETSEGLLKAVFGDDRAGLAIFLKRAEGFTVPEILAKLNISEQQYDTITRRIRRKISKLQSNQKEKETL